MCIFAMAACGDETDQPAVDGSVPSPDSAPDTGDATPESDAGDTTLDGGADGGPEPDAGAVLDPTPYVADVVHDAPGASGSGFGDPQRAVNGVRGGGLMQGSLDVYSLSYGENYYITLRWSGRRVGNGPGIDFAVFENGFGYPDSGQFMDQIIVEVSVDGVEWRALPFDYLADDESVYSTDPSLWFGFAGVSPVLYHAEDNPVDPLDPSVAGGDGFDLDALPGDDPVSSELRENGFVYVRLVTAPSQLNPDTGLPFVRDSLSNGADIDGIIGRYLVDHTD